jgi:hypothetical protein
MAEKKIDELKALASDRAIRHGQTTDAISLGLEYLAIEAVAQTQDFIDTVIGDELASQMKFSDWHTGASGDGSIDGILFDEDLTRVAIIQTKYYSGKVDANIYEAARAFFDKLPTWADVTKRGSFNEQTQRLLDDSNLDPKKQQVDLYFITSMTNSERDHAALADEKTSQYRDLGMNVNCFFFTLPDFLDFFENVLNAQSGSKLPELDLKISQSDYIVNTDGPHKILVGVIKGQELASLYNRRDVKNKLFVANVRAALSSGKINPKIQETAKEQSGKFLYFNNGVTATCTSLTAIQSTITVEDLQVVNGAQTVVALAKALRGTSNTEVRVLIRIIETRDTNVTEQITRYQNTQNPVKAADFFANEPLQTWLAAQIDTMSGKDMMPPTWYEHKRGVKNGSTSNRRKLTMEQLATLRYACLHEPTFTYKTARDIWNGEDDNKNYWLAFGRGADGEAVQQWNREELAEMAWMVHTWFKLRDKHTELMKPGAPENPEKTWLGVLSRYVTALMHSLVINLQAQGTLPSFEELTKNPAAYEEILELVQKTCRGSVRRAIKGDRWKTVANPRLNMPQDADQWTEIKIEVLEEYRQAAEA